MALVAYDYGSDSDEGEDVESETRQNNENGTKNELLNGNSSNVNQENGVLSKSNEPNLSSEISDEEDSPPVSNHTATSMFEKLPQIKEAQPETTKPELEDVIEEFVPKADIQTKRKAKVQISIPALSDFDDVGDDAPPLKKIKQSVKGTGLLALLPPVKCVPLSTKSFVPNVLTQKKKQNEQNKKPSKTLIPHSVRIKKQESILKNEAKAKDNESDDSDVEMPETYDEELWQKVCGRKVVKKKVIEEPIVEEPAIINAAPEAVAPYQGLDNTAFKELVGKSSRIPRNIKLIDINEDELVAEKDLWMTKSLTDPEYRPKPSEDDDDDSIDPTKKKKHHITYLAQRAKAIEQELQSQWASSKHNRMQSRAKYGF